MCFRNASRRVLTTSRPEAKEGLGGRLAVVGQRDWETLPTAVPVIELALPCHVCLAYRAERNQFCKLGFGDPFRVDFQNEACL